MIRVESYCTSIDGYGAGPNQSLENPLGVGGQDVFQWFFPTRTFQERHGEGGGVTGIDNDFAARGFTNVGAWILGRNMFAHSRGPWPSNDSWKGWWGPNPPYHVPVFVLTHYARPDLVMEGGTTFYFVTDGIESALERAKKAAGTKDVRIGGGAATIQQYLRARLIDEMHFAISPVVLGSGELLFRGLNLRELGYHCREVVAGEKATHVVLARA